VEYHEAVAPSRQRRTDLRSTQEVWEVGQVELMVELKVELKVEEELEVVLFQNQRMGLEAVEEVLLPQELEAMQGAELELIQTQRKDHWKLQLVVLEPVELLPEGMRIQYWPCQALWQLAAKLEASLIHWLQGTLRMDWKHRELVAGQLQTQRRDSQQEEER